MICFVLNAFGIGDTLKKSFGQNFSHVRRIIKQKNPMQNTSTAIFRVFLPFAFGYFLSYLFRVVNAVIAPDIVKDLNIDPSQLGLLTATYFISFAASQMPLGILLDRFGPRIVESLLLIFAGLGAFIFARSDSLGGVILGRAFIGFGVSACLMAAFKSYVLWFPSVMWPRINGFQMAAGGLGALSATLPVECVLKVTDWRGLFFILAGLCFMVALAVFLIVPEKQSDTKLETVSKQLDGLKTILGSQDFWQVAPLTALSQAGYLSLQGLWAGPWLKDVAGLQRTDVAFVLSCSATAMIAGYILLGLLGETLAKKGIPILLTAVGGITAFIGIQFAIALQLPLPPVLVWTNFGFFGTSGILAYAALSYMYPKHLSGRVTTSVNMLVFIAAFCLQWLIGIIMNLWETSATGQYHPAGYKAGFLTVLALQMSGLIWFMVILLKAKRKNNFFKK